eukprot:TRINITY_DN186_c0_g1_i2.p2 TRINITY_DN186_c0_g1~~TRINITY_DN186_c0_g1_i2.p2  ORF type:complete len:311 (-),score=89.89 TRINITY_DN186_c0_g1_i2:249-1181(-)
MERLAAGGAAPEKALRGEGAAGGQCGAGAGEGVGDGGQSAETQAAATQRTVLYLSHGAGPMPLLGDPSHRDMVANLERIAAAIDRPAAILLISAHWEEAHARVQTGAAPPLLYDYFGFPPAAYRVQYSPPGHPELAHLVLRALESEGVRASGDDERGFDHGMFVPLKIMYPAGDIPVVQLSLLASLSAQEHVRLGEALRSVPFDRLLVVGSGFSSHNIGAYRALPPAEARARNGKFQRWLHDTVSDDAIGEDRRRHALVQWEDAPEARFCHAREEHLLPLHVCYGVAGRPASGVFELEIFGVEVRTVLWT